MDRSEAVRSAAAVLPGALRRALLSDREQARLDWEEIRLRAGRGLFWVDGQGRERQVFQGGQAVPVTGEDLRLCVELATRASFQSAGDKLAAGFLPLKGGHRLGLCGTAAVREGRILHFRALSSVNIRIACPIPGIGERMLPALMEGELIQSTLILAPPGEGKTTLLRDLLRLLGQRGIRSGLADERGEVASVWDGVPQLDVGPMTDVVDGCPKGEGLLLLLRTMSPQVLAADEITHPDDVSALCQGANCGAAVLATAHGASLDELEHRAVFRPLLEQKIFRRLVTIHRTRDGRSYQVGRL